MADDLTAVLAGIRGRADDLGRFAEVGDIRDSANDVPGLLYAAETVLELHAQTAFARYTEACSNHLYTILPRRTCPDCRRVERLGCQRCRDENGNPAKPEDCFERSVILAALTGKAAGGA
jgi:hypothetical protein